MRLEFNGVVTTGDPYRCDHENPAGAIFIGGVDVVDEIHERPWKDNVVAIVDGVNVASGSVVADVGWGYSSWTPIDSDKLRIGDGNLIEHLEGLAGKTVSVVITDEDIDVPPPAPVQ